MDDSRLTKTDAPGLNYRYLGLAALVPLLVAAWSLGYITSRPLKSDNHQNLRIAYHLIHTGVWGYNEVETPNPRPQIRREPLPVLAIATWMILDPQFDAPFTIADAASGRLVTEVKKVNAFWVALASFAIFLLVGELFSYSYKAVAISAAAVIATSYLIFFKYMDELMMEVPAILFMVLSTWLGIRFTRERSVRNAVLLGIALGLLTLVKASFLYIGIGYILLLLLIQPSISAVAGTGRLSKPNLLRYGTIALAMLATLTPWVLRNVSTFGMPVVTSRGGDIIAFRALLTEQPLSDSVYMFSPGPLRPFVAEMLGRTPDASVFAQYKHLKRERWPIYRERMAAAGIPYEGMTKAEPWLTREAIKYFAKNPFRYALSCLVFGYRGIWFMDGSYLLGDKKFAYAAHITWVNAIAFLSFLAIAVWALIRRDPVLTAFVGLGLGAILFYSLVSHNIVRYSHPITPFLFIALFWWLDALLRGLWGIRWPVQEPTTTAT